MTAPNEDFDCFYRKEWPRLAGVLAAMAGSRSAGEEVARSKRAKVARNGELSYYSSFGEVPCPEFRLG